MARISDANKHRVEPVRIDRDTFYDVFTIEVEVALEFSYEAPVTDYGITIADKDENDASEEKGGCGGCGSSAAISAIAIVAVIGTAAVIKKKED